MKKKIFMLLAMVCMTLTASAGDVPTYSLTKADGAEAHGTITFKVGDATVTSAAEGDIVTVTITPAEGWVVNEPSGQWIAAVAASRNRVAAQGTSIDLLNGIELTPVKDVENTWTFTMERANAEISATYKKVIQASWIADIAAQTYTGQALTPTVSVKDGETTLVLNTDYTVEYSNNTNAALATATENAPTVTITAVETSDKYAGEVTKTFTINKADITTTAPTAKELTYNAQAQELIAAGSIEGAGNMQECEMQYSLDNETFSTALPTGIDAGEYTVYYKVVSDDNHNEVEAQSIKVNIEKAALKSATLVNATLIYDTFNHLPLTAEVSEVTAGEDGSLTVPADDYTVEGNTQTDKGTYTVTVTAKEDSKNFTGSTTVDFSIVDEVIDVDEENVPVIVTADPETKTVTIDKIMKPKSGTTVHIPAEINGYKVTKIAAGALDVASGVTDIYLPDTDEPIEIEAGALPANVTIHTSLALLDDYAMMTGLQPNYEGMKVMTTVTPKNRLWTLGVGCDVILPDGLTASTVQLNNPEAVQTLVITEKELKLGAVDNTRVVKAYNGVLLSGKAGQSYDLVAYSKRIASGTAVVAGTVKKDYGENILEPVIEPTDYPATGYYVLKDNEFHRIMDNHSLVPAGKAVLRASGTSARVLSIVGEAVTGVDTLNVERGTLNDNSFYDLNGRKLDAKPTKKGVYIQNGRKVVVK